MFSSKQNSKEIMSQIYNLPDLKSSRVLKKIEKNKDYLGNESSEMYPVKLKNLIEVEANSNSDDITSSISSNLSDYVKVAGSSGAATIAGASSVLAASININMFITIIVAIILIYVLYALYMQMQKKINSENVKKINHNYMRFLLIIILSLIVMYYIYY
jgi:hypothetical protein